MIVLPPSAKLAISGAVAHYVEFGQPVMFRKNRAGDHRIVEVSAVLSAGDHGLAAEGEAHAARAQSQP